MKMISHMLPANVVIMESAQGPALAARVNFGIWSSSWSVAGASESG